MAVGSSGGQTLTIDVANGESYSYSGRLGGASGIFDNNFALVKDGAGTQQLAGTNTYQGTTSINAGRLVIEQPLDSSALNPGDVTVATGAEVVLEGGSGTAWTDGQMQNFLANQTFGPGTTTFGIKANDEDFTFTGVISGDKNFVRAGGQDGTAVTLTASQSYTGTTAVERGQLRLDVANALPTGTVVTIG